MIVQYLYINMNVYVMEISQKLNVDSSHRKANASDTLTSISDMRLCFEIIRLG